MNEKTTLPSGLTLYMIPKKGYVEKQAAVSVGFGSADIRYRTGNGEIVETPLGTAHFLEHKMFESEKENVYDAFIKGGASVNAFTDFSNTAYYFTCVDNFEENLRRLLKRVREPYFTDENVEKEKGIITQEINMYRDDAQWRLYVNLHGALFSQSPVRYDIAGTEESIGDITKDVLYQCYENFYKPSNMALICAGDFDVARVSEIAGEAFDGVTNNGEPAGHMYGDEPPEAASGYTEEVMPVSMPLFQIGFKDVPNGIKGRALAHLTAASRLLADIVAGESSPFYARLYDDGLIDNHFSVAYIGGVFYGTSLFAGNSADPRQVEAKLTEEIARLNKEGIPAERFGIIRDKAIGRYMRSLNNLDAVVTSQIDLHAKELEINDMLDIYKRITLPDVEERLRAHLREDNRALSVVLPE